VLLVAATFSPCQAVGQQEQHQRLPQPEQIYHWNSLPENEDKREQAHKRTRNDQKVAACGATYSKDLRAEIA
jgi:hypothetical protein